ncbi:MAG TPA: hypothetical protein VIC26_05460 [Marinagarivorans sp.]
MPSLPLQFSPSVATALFCLITLALQGCSGEPQTSSSPLSSTATVSSSIASASMANSSSAPSVTIDAGADQTVRNSSIVTLDAQVSNGAQPAWQQLEGPAVEWLQEPGNDATAFIAPDVREDTPLVFEAAIAGDSDTVTINVQPCNSAPNMLFDDCTAPGFGAWISYESGPETGPFFHRNGRGDYHVQWQQVDSGDAERGRVMEITWNANDADNSQAVKGWFGLAMPGTAATQGMDLSEYADGEISFDMRMVYHEQPSMAAGFIFKSECIHPCSSAEMPVANSASFEWQNHRYPLNQLRASGLDITRTNHIFVLQPDWFQQDQNVTVQIDNLKLTPTVERPPIAEGCLAAGNMSYTLSRAANPTADQQEAYDLITAAMDRAIENYNCYSNLSRHLSVQYNPSVQTADGSTNGNIRFGSRASMHHVTAMHEIAHTFGAGGSNTFRGLVVDGIFTGPTATAKVKELTGDSSEELHSDGTHFWPFGLNYISEGSTQQDLINHCIMVEAIYTDLLNN